MATPRNQTRYRTLDVVNADARVYEVYQDSDGIWLYPAPGWTAERAGAHGIHETTAREVLARYRFLKPCDCDECKATLQFAKGE